MTEPPKKRRRNSYKLQPFFIVITIIIILLMIILVIVKTGSPKEAKVSEKENYNFTSEKQETNENIKNNTISSKEEEKNNELEQKDLPEQNKPTEKIKPDMFLVFIIDDVGNSIKDLQLFLELPFSVTFAIMPDRKFTSQSISMINAAGKEYILHQPMEAIGGENPGESAIYTKMTEEEVFKTLEHNFNQLPNALGMNNHMGSAVTSNIDTMLKVMKYLSKNNKFFLDSFTIPNSVAGKAAENTNVKYLQRNSMFLDNENDKDLIIRAIETGKNTAKKRGHAIMIGHIMTAELAEAMLELYPGFIEEGFTLKEVSELFIEMNSLSTEE